MGVVSPETSVDKPCRQVSLLDTHQVSCAQQSKAKVLVTIPGILSTPLPPKFCGVPSAPERSEACLLLLTLE